MYKNLKRMTSEERICQITLKNRSELMEKIHIQNDKKEDSILYLFSTKTENISWK